MKIDHTRMTAVLRTHVSSAGAMAGRIGAACMLVCAVAGTVQAQDRNGFRKDDLQQQQRDDRGERQRQDAQRFEQRDRADDARRQQQERNADAQRHSGRLTPDERRDLRRQINEAGVDLYPNTPRR